VQLQIAPAPLRIETRCDTAFSQIPLVFVTLQLQHSLGIGSEKENTKLAQQANDTVLFLSVA